MDTYKLIQMSNPLKKMHPKGRGCDLILHYVAKCSERTAAVNKFWTFYEIIVFIQNTV